MARRQPITFGNLVRRFARERRGNVAIAFALSILPVVGVVGAAIDYSHGNQVKSAMQAAADATALMLAQNANSLTDTQVTSKANEYFNAQFIRSEVTGLTVNAVYTRGAGSQIVVTASGKVPTHFTGLVGLDTMTVGVESQVKWGMGKLQVALALDNTGSMAMHGKITALKTATLSLLDMLKGAVVNKDDVQVAIVPFAKEVNVGKTNANAAWMDFGDWDDQNTGTDATNISGSICYNGQLWTVSAGSWSYGGTCSSPAAGICYEGRLWNWNGSQFVRGARCTVSAVNRTAWQGCVTDRDQDYDIVNTKPTPAIPGTLFKAVQAVVCPAPLKGLTSDWTALINLVGTMTPSGNTNNPIGLFWAWMALSNGEPLNAPVKGPDTTQVIILLSDGMNTENRWSTSQAVIDDRQQKLCDNIKKAGITIYAIQVNTGGDPLSNVMKSCATDPSKFFMLTNASQIIATFNEIGTKISKIRIAS